MSEQWSDFELLLDFARQGNQRAFASLVQRHLNLVYGTAIRKVGDPGAAEEIAQTVFATLARKAWQFAPDDSVPAWLHRATLVEATAWLRGELRRRRREQTAAELGSTMKASDENSAVRALVPLLDDALLSLREQDRAAVLLRFYEGRSLRDVGAALGVGEDAAQKRVAGAMEKLARYFQRCGLKTVTGALAAATLQQTAVSAPAVVGSSVVQAMTQLAPPALSGFTTLLSRIASLTRMQTAALCVLVAAAPVSWQWIEARAAGKDPAEMSGKLDSIRVEKRKISAEIERLGAQSAQLNDRLAAASDVKNQDQQAWARWQASQGRIRGLLTDADHRWEADLPYIRIPKSMIGKLGMLGKFSYSGTISEPALEILGMTPDEQQAAERALGNYWQGVKNMMAARAYETNAPDTTPGRIYKTVIVPPLGAELKTLAADTRRQLTEQLGAEREKILFGGWDEGAIQIFWPGNLWKISEEPQTITAWVEPAVATSDGVRYGSGWSSKMGGTSTARGLGILPHDVAAQFFAPWLRQFGITNALSATIK